jgi:hypothetical protein
MIANVVLKVDSQRKIKALRQWRKEVFGEKMVQAFYHGFNLDFYESDQYKRELKTECFLSWRIKAK